MRTKLIIVILALGFYVNLSGQKYSFKFDNLIYDEDISTVTLELGNSPAVFPILNIDSKGAKLVLRFDDLSNVERNFYYRIIHCNKDWSPSVLKEIEYIKGFNDERIRNYEYSQNTRNQYIHYWQSFPNVDTDFKLSGNYLLVIYEDDIKYPILSRRFLVTENLTKPMIKSIFPTDVENLRFKQEFQVDVAVDNLKLRFPLEEVTVMMIQNQNWNLYRVSKPMLVSGNTLRFNKLRSFDFYGLREFRDFDTRTIMSASRNIQFLDRSQDYVKAQLFIDKPRWNMPYNTLFDYNGSFYIDNFENKSGRPQKDMLNTLLGSSGVDSKIKQELRQSLTTTERSRFSSNLTTGETADERHLSSEYIVVSFSLDMSTIPMDYTNKDIYVLGGFNNYIPSQAYKMVYNETEDLFVLNLLLKQGYYNYQYVLLDSNGESDYHSIDGSWTETENEYLTLIYFRGIGDLYDRLVGFNTLNTDFGF